MSTELVTAQSFEDRLKNRIKDSMGDLLTDEELSKMVQRGVESVFFTRAETRDRWGTVTGTEPSVVDKIVKELLEPKVRAAVVDWIDNNPAAVTAAINSMLEKGAGLALMAAVGSLFQSDMNTLRMNIDERLRNGNFR